MSNAESPIHRVSRQDVLSETGRFRENERNLTDLVTIAKEWAIAIALLQVLIGGLIVWLTYTQFKQSQSFQTLVTDRSEQAIKIEALLAERIKQTAEIEALRAETSELKQTIGVNSEREKIFLKILLLKKNVDRNIASTIARHVHHYSRVYGQDPDLILSIMYNESFFEPDAVSDKGAVGLMQVMPQWKQVLGIKEDLSDPETSIKYGLQILGFYQAMYKETEMALTAYNRGPGPVDMALMKGKSPTNHYAPLILKTYDRLKSMNPGKW